MTADSKCKTARLIHKLVPGGCAQHVNSCKDEKCPKDCGNCKAVRQSRKDAEIRVLCEMERRNTIKANKRSKGSGSGARS